MATQKEAIIGTTIAPPYFGEPTTRNVRPAIPDGIIFPKTNLHAECLQLRAKNAKLEQANAKLKAANEGQRAKVVAMQATIDQLKEKQINLASIIGGIAHQIKEEFPKFPLISGVYCAFSEQMNEIYVNVVMDSLDYDTEKELIKFFIRQEDEFPYISMQTRFPVLSIEEAEDIYQKEGFNLCYKRHK